jgi:hypothetical protein
VELIVQPDAHDVVHEMPVRGEWPANGVAKGNIAGGITEASVKVGAPATAAHRNTV